jgi:hypothetical protein
MDAFKTVSFLKRLCGDRFASETALQWFNNQNRHLDLDLFFIFYPLLSIAAVKNFR